MSKSPDNKIFHPFLKWAGGKQWLSAFLKPFIQQGKGRYIEPFLGGGSVFFASQPKRAWISDSNKELIDTYKTIQNDAESIIARLKRFSFTEECYYRVRESNPLSPIGKAARFIFLNRTCWNGLYRVNRQGKFNVPMGSFESMPDFSVTERLMGAKMALRGATISCQDFEQAVQKAKAGDTVFLDPPYTVAHKNNGFLRYNERVFSWHDQQRLAFTSAALRDKGCRIILTNADHPSIIDLYKDFKVKKLKRKSLVASKKTKRRPITELLITSFPHNK